MPATQVRPDEVIRKAFPDHLVDHALRLNALGYRVQYQRTASKSNRMRLAREAVLAESDTLTRLRLTLHHRRPDLSGDLEAHGSVYLDGTQMRFTPFDSLADFWRFAEGGGICLCGKVPMSEDYANRALLGALKARVLDDNPRRRERRVYSCTRWKGVYHLTSQE